MVIHIYVKCLREPKNLVLKLILNMKNSPEKMCDQTLLLVPVAYLGTYRNHFMSHIIMVGT